MKPRLLVVGTVVIAGLGLGVGVAVASTHHQAVHVAHHARTIKAWKRGHRPIPLNGRQPPPTPIPGPPSPTPVPPQQ